VDWDRNQVGILGFGKRQKVTTPDNSYRDDVYARIISTESDVEKLSNELPFLEVQFGRDAMFECRNSVKQVKVELTNVYSEMRRLDQSGQSLGWRKIITAIEHMNSVLSEVNSTVRDLVQVSETPTEYLVKSQELTEAVGQRVKKLRTTAKLLKKSGTAWEISEIRSAVTVAESLLNAIEQNQDAAHSLIKQGETGKAAVEIRQANSRLNKIEIECSRAEQIARSSKPKQKVVVIPPAKASVATPAEAFPGERGSPPRPGGAAIELEDDVRALLAKCKSEPHNAEKYANLVLDIDPTNQAAQSILRTRRK